MSRDGADIESFLEMMAVERGAADNTVAAYRRDLEDTSGFLAGQRRLARHGDRRTISAPSSPHLVRARLRALEPGPAHVLAAPVLPLPLRRGACARDDPTGPIETQKKARALPKVMSEDEAGRRSSTPRRPRPRAPTSRRPRWRGRGGCMRWSRSSTRRACACPNSSACRARSLRSALADDRRARQGRQGAHGAARRARPATRWRRSRAALRTAEIDAVGRAAAADQPWLFPALSESGHLTRQAFARDLKALAIARRHPGRARLAARAAPCLRQPSPAERRRSARRAGTARPCRHLDDADLHPCPGRAAAPPRHRPPSAVGGEPETDAPAHARRRRPNLGIGPSAAAGPGFLTRRGRIASLRPNSTPSVPPRRFVRRLPGMASR